VNKVLIGNKSDWTDKRAVTEEEGRQLADELGIKFIETSAKINEGVEDAFFTLARSVHSTSFSLSFFLLTCFHAVASPRSSDIKARLIDSQADATGAQPSAAPDSIRVNQPAAVQGPGCCS